MYIRVNTYEYNVRYIGVYTWTHTKRIRTCRESRRKRESRERKQGSKSPPEIFFEKSREIFRQSSTIRISRRCSLKIQCTHFLHCEEEEEKESMLRRLVDRHEWRRIGKLGFQECNSLVPELQKKKLGPVGMQKEERQSSASKCFVVAGKICWVIGKRIGLETIWEGKNTDKVLCFLVFLQKFEAGADAERLSWEMNTWGTL